MKAQEASVDTERALDMAIPSTLDTPQSQDISEQDKKWAESIEIQSLAHLNRTNLNALWALQRFVKPSYLFWKRASFHHTNSRSGFAWLNVVVVPCERN